MTISKINVNVHSLSLQLGTRLIDLLTQNAFVQPPLEQQFVEAPPDVRPAFTHKLKLVRKDPWSVLYLYSCRITSLDM